MNGIVYLFITSVFLTDYAFSLGVIPRAMKWLPDLMSGLIMLLVIAKASAGKKPLISGRYVALFMFAGSAYAASIIANQVDPGAVFAGMRNYLRCLPLFLLPWVFPFDKLHLKRQAVLVFLLMALQLPVSIYQRFFAYAELRTGDVVTGTLGSPGMMSIILISGMALLFAAYLKGRVSWRILGAGGMVLLIPVGINETAASLFFIPLAFMIPAVFIDSERRGKYMVSAALVGGAFLVAFVAIYNMYYSRWEGGVQDIVASGEAAQYLYKGADENSRAGGGLEQKEIGRVDSFMIPLKVLGDDISALALGRGVGNVALSFSDHLAGEYVEEYGSLGSHFTTLGFLLWETGVIGVIAVLWYLGLVFFDAKLVRGRGDIFGALSLGWMAVVCLIVMSLAYKNIMTHTTVSFMFALYSGVVASKAAAVRQAIRPSVERLQVQYRPAAVPRHQGVRGRVSP